MREEDVHGSTTSWMIWTLEFSSSPRRYLRDWRRSRIGRLARADVLGDVVAVDVNLLRSVCTNDEANVIAGLHLDLLDTATGCPPRTTHDQGVVVGLSSVSAGSVSVSVVVGRRLGLGLGRRSRPSSRLGGRRRLCRRCRRRRLGGADVSSEPRSRRAPGGGQAGRQQEHSRARHALPPSSLDVTAERAAAAVLDGRARPLWAAASAARSAATPPTAPAVRRGASRGRGGVLERPPERLGGAPSARAASRATRERTEAGGAGRRGTSGSVTRPAADRPGDEALEVLLEREAERAARARAARRPVAPAIGLARAPTACAASPATAHRGAGSEQERRRCQVAVTGPGQQIVTRRRCRARRSGTRARAPSSEPPSSAARRRATRAARRTIEQIMPATCRNGGGTLLACSGTAERR